MFADTTMTWNTLDGIDLMVSGTGGATLRQANHHPKPESLFAASEHGFLDLQIDSRELTAQFYNTALKPLENPPLTRTHP